MVPAFLFYRHKWRGTCTERCKVVVFSPNRGCTVGDYCRKYTVGALKSMASGVAVVLGDVLISRRSRRRPGSASGRHGGSCRGYRPVCLTWRCSEGPAGGGLDWVKIRAAPEGRAHAIRGACSRGGARSRQHSGKGSAVHVRTARRKFPQWRHSTGDGLSSDRSWWIGPRSQPLCGVVA